jgi:hypothetical protein
MMNRGDRREAVFQGEEDYQLFLRTLEQACQKAKKWSNPTLAQIV